MKVLVGFFRIFVGVLFIISGLIKLNDPVGFSFKLGDYFAPDVLNLEFLTPYALALAVVLVIVEVLLGIMLILGYAKKLTLWSLLIMIVLFTFLTFYSAYFNKVTDCGCFGDALPLVPWESFAKDVVLLVMILVLFYGQRHIQPFFTKLTNTGFVFVSFLLCMLLGYHVLMHLPVIDFRAYKIGNNIPEGLAIPDGAPEPIFDYNWKFNINGQEQIITTDGDYPKVEGEFIEVETILVQKGYEPPIHDFSMEREGRDYQEELLATENLIVVIAYNLDVTEAQGWPAVKNLTEKAANNGYKVIGMSASSPEETEKLKATYSLNFDFYFCDMTTLKTIVRSNPGILELDKGTIKQKVHWNDVDKFQIIPSKVPTVTIDLDLKRQLDSVGVLDQKYRGADYQENWALQQEIDSTNLVFIERVFKKHGYPGKSLVGTPTNSVAWYVIQHSQKIPEYLPLIKKAGAANEIPYRQVAMMEDRFLMGQNKPQVYGTQGTSRVGLGNIIWPIEDPENVNARRMEAGYSSTVEEYAKQLYGEEFEYKVLTIDDLSLE